MDIRYRSHNKKWLVEVWTKNTSPGWEDFDEPYPEEIYIAINDWCIAVLGYNARTAYHIFELKNRSHLEWFLLRWQ